MCVDVRYGTFRENNSHAVPVKASLGQATLKFTGVGQVTRDQMQIVDSHISVQCLEMFVVIATEATLLQSWEIQYETLLSIDYQRKINFVVLAAVWNDSLASQPEECTVKASST